MIMRKKFSTEGYILPRMKQELKNHPKDYLKLKKKVLKYRKFPFKHNNKNTFKNQSDSQY